MSTSPHQLALLADHLKLSLLERQRAEALNLPQTPATSTNIARSLETLSAGINTLAQQPQPDSKLARLRAEYRDLYSQYHGHAPPTPATTEPNDPSLAEDFEAARQRPGQPKRNKSVRFRDNPSDAASAPYRDQPEEDAAETANRAALFSGGYSDEEPSTASQHQQDLSNQQIHAHHSQVLREQDDQLDVLGQSIGRQRLLGIEMGNELDEQGALLEDVEAGVDRHQSTLDRARGRLGRVARKGKDNWSWVTIGILVCILVLLIVVLK